MMNFYNAIIVLLLSFKNTTAVTAIALSQSEKERHLLRGSTQNRGFHKQDKSVFEPAMSLDFFKNLDPEAFEWINRNEIAPGEVTCGYLKAPLGALPDVNYPTVKVYVCVKFAPVQPAPKGNLVVHCGGPGSLSVCVYVMGGEESLGSQNADQYNVIAFDQRGLGRSEPTFVIEECNVRSYDPMMLRSQINFNDEDSIRAVSQLYKERALGCWAHDSFKLKAQSKEGYEKTYHFLEYSGTHQLAEDIERVREIFGGQKLNLFGVSYGTKVMGAYATIFPNSVNLLVLDGNDDPNTDIVKNARDIARSMNQRIDFFISSCEMFPESCPVDNMRKCINELNDIFIENGDDIEATFGTTNPSDLMFSIIVTLFYEFEKAPLFCNLAAEGNYFGLKKMLQGSNPAAKKQYNIPFLKDKSFDFLPPMDSASKPTSGFSDVWPFANYTTRSALLAQDLVTAQDYAFGAYDEDQYVEFLMDLNELFPGAGTSIPVLNSFQWYSACYFWPNTSPMPPIGSPQVSGIIAGQIYDPYTPYIWTQKMRENFKMTSLLTSRSVNHGMSSTEEDSVIDPICMKNIHDYFSTGAIAFPDGTVCESDPIGTSCTIVQVITGSTCDRVKKSANHTFVSVE